MNWRTVALCAITASTLGLSGCGSSGGGSGSDSSGPVKLMVIESMTGATGVDQTDPKGAEAAASAINKDGGIGGRDIKILSCDTASDPNKATECARKAISEKVTAVVGGFDPIGIAASLPVLAAAKIPYVSPVATMPGEFSSPNSFPLTSGAPGGTFGQIAAAKDAGCKNVGTVGDTKADSGQTQALVNGLKAAGLNAYYVNLPTGSTDVTPVVAQLLDKKPDCVAYAANGQVGVQLFAGIRKAGSNAQIITAVASLLPPFLKALGKDGEGIIATQDAPPLNAPALKPFLDEVKKYQPNVQANPFTLAGWYGVQTVSTVAKDLKSVDAATVMAAMNKTTDLQLPGLEKIDLTKTTKSKLYSRMFHPYVQYAKVQNGTYVNTDTTWHDISTYLP